MDRRTVQKNRRSKTLDILHDELNRLAQATQFFTNPSINRQQLAEMLHTNEKYLSECIRLYKGVTVNTYLNQLRLEHACRLLTHPTEEYTIESISVDSGFGARNTFHTIFRQHYGTTPDEYRRQNRPAPNPPVQNEK